MSTTISVGFRNATTKKLADLNIRAIDIFARARFLLPDRNGAKDTDWLGVFTGVLDTGAQLSVIPRGIWEQCWHKHLGIRTTIKVAGTAIGAELGIVRCQFLDQLRTSPPIDVRAHLATTPSTTIIFGLEDVILKNVLRVDHDGPHGQIAHLRFPS